jgi:hypothetical protein
MNKIGTFILVTVLLMMLSACFSTRTDLFNIPIEEDTYTLNDNLEEFVVVDGKVITYISLIFKDLNQTALEDDEFTVNTFGDFSFDDIKIFEIEFYLGIDDNEPKKYDLIFLGKANPGRSNAYAFSAVIDELHHNTSNYRLVLELNTHIGGYDDRIAYFRLQFKNASISDVGAIVTLRNELESKTAESLRLLRETFNSFKREDYEQEGWNDIYAIERSARESINKALDMDTINIVIEQAFIDFDNVPLKE